MAHPVLVVTDMRFIAVIALLAGCLHAPSNKPAVYAASAGVIALGALAGYYAAQNSCDHGGVGEAIQCNINETAGTGFAITMIALGFTGIGFTALAPEAPIVVVNPAGADSGRPASSR